MKKKKHLQTLIPTLIWHGTMLWLTKHPRKYILHGIFMTASHLCAWVDRKLFFIDIFLMKIFGWKNLNCTCCTAYRSLVIAAEICSIFPFNINRIWFVSFAIYTGTFRYSLRYKNKNIERHTSTCVAVLLHAHVFQLIICCRNWKHARDVTLFFIVVVFLVMWYAFTMHKISLIVLYGLCF